MSKEACVDTNMSCIVLHMAGYDSTNTTIQLFKDNLFFALPRIFLRWGNKLCHFDH